jgi:hypothetical protein
MPFERLMQQVAALPEQDRDLTMGVLSQRWGEPASRIGDAIDALKVLRGEPSYIPYIPWPEIAPGWELPTRPEGVL